MIAKIIKEDEDGYTILINESEYQGHIDDLHAWIKEVEILKKKGIHLEHVDPLSGKTKAVKKIVLTEELL